MLTDHRLPMKNTDSEKRLFKAVEVAEVEQMGIDKAKKTVLAQN